MRVTAGEAYQLVAISSADSSEAYWLLMIRKWEAQHLITWREAKYLRLYRDQESFLNRREVRA